MTTIYYYNLLLLFCVPFFLSLSLDSAGQTGYLLEYGLGKENLIFPHL